MRLLWQRIFLPFALGYFLSYFLRNANAVIAPELSHELQLSAADLGLLTASYLLVFGAVQLPLGVLLDRFGPRRVEALLLVIAACGCLIFASSHTLYPLAIGRAIIGLGVSACLMASFKAFSLWSTPERLASLNAAVMAAGALGALSATTPLAYALPLIGWRGIYSLLAGLTLLIAFVIWTTPEKSSAESAKEPWGSQIKALASIFKSRAYWVFAPQSTLMVGGFMAIQGLWAMPWLTEVSRYSRTDAALHLFTTSVGMLCGFLFLALGLRPLQRLGITALQLLRFGMLIGILTWLLIVFGSGGKTLTLILWFILGGVFAAGNLAYALLGQYFPSAVSGRVNTLLNLAVFVGAFGLQWGMGIVIDILQRGGTAPAMALIYCFALLLFLQCLSHVWFVIGTRQLARTAQS